MEIDIAWSFFFLVVKFIKFAPVVVDGYKKTIQGRVLKKNQRRLGDK